jgi:DNA polymerase-3 subunit delta
MTPAQFLAQLAEREPAPVYLFLGAEAYLRERCRRALIERVLPEADRESGLTRHDLEEATLTEVVDDARSLSLFAPRRLIWVSSAESALPRGPASSAEQSGNRAVKLLADYVEDPSPGVVLVLEARRYDFEGEGKKRLERVRKFYSFIAARVEFPRYSTEEAHRLTWQLARDAGLNLNSAEIGLLVEAVGGDAARIAVEIEKLSLYAGESRTVSAEQIARLAPNARATTIFAMVASLGRGDRRRALQLLDILVREGEYLPLALAFLGTQFRQALVAKEAGLRGAQQIQSYFSRMGVPMWPSRARQVHETVSSFSGEQLKSALGKIYLADKALRDTRPDDRTIMEEFVLSVTG